LCFWQQLWRFLDNGRARIRATRWLLRPAVLPLGLALFRNRRNCHIADMTTAEDIEKAVEALAPRELDRFRAWFEAFDAGQFDAAIERDICAGKLDAHAEEALAAHRAGRSRDV
jgi:hypothetical protein